MLMAVCAYWYDPCGFSLRCEGDGVGEENSVRRPRVVIKKVFVGVRLTVERRLLTEWTYVGAPQGHVNVLHVVPYWRERIDATTRRVVA